MLCLACRVMQLLKKVSDQVLLQVITDALRERHIEFTVENAGMNALMPLAGLFDTRILVASRDMDAAQRILRDLGEADD